MSESRLQKLEDRVLFLRKEAEAYKQQSYQQADLLSDVVPALSRLGHAANAKTLDAAQQLSRGVRENSQNVDALRVLADEFLSTYQHALDSGELQPHDTVWRNALADVLDTLTADLPRAAAVAGRVRVGDSLHDAFSAIADKTQAWNSQGDIGSDIAERLNQLVAAMPFDQVERVQVNRVTARLRAERIEPHELADLLGELGYLFDQAQQAAQSRDKALHAMVLHLLSELGAVGDFLTAQGERDTTSLADAIAVEQDVLRGVSRATAAFDHHEALDDIRQQVFKHTGEIRSRMQDYAEACRVQHDTAARENRALAVRLASMESELGATQDALAEAERIASLDFLTNLLNRRAFESAIQGWLDPAAVPADLHCVIWDIDHFKDVNDTHGHQVGDAVLKAIASVLQERASEQDLVARLGGEEFVTAVTGVETASVLDWADTVREHIGQQCYAEDGCTVSVSVSCGIAVYQRGDSMVSMLARADKALYDAKHQGRNRCLLAA